MIADTLVIASKGLLSEAYTESVRVEWQGTRFFVDGIYQSNVPLQGEPAHSQLKEYVLVLPNELTKLIEEAQLSWWKRLWR